MAENIELHEDVELTKSEMRKRRAVGFSMIGVMLGSIGLGGRLGYAIVQESNKQNRLESVEAAKATGRCIDALKTIGAFVDGEATVVLGEGSLLNQQATFDCELPTAENLSRRVTHTSYNGKDPLLESVQVSALSTPIKLSDLQKRQANHIESSQKDNLDAIAVVAGTAIGSLGGFAVSLAALVGATELYERRKNRAIVEAVA